VSPPDPISAAAEGLRAARRAALGAALAAGDEPRQVELQALAGALGLLAAALAADAGQIATVQRLLGDLAAGESPERAIGVLAVTLARHAVGSREEAARAVARAWAESRGGPAADPAVAALAGAARLVLLTTAWLDPGTQVAAAVARAEAELTGAGSADQAATALAEALGLLGRLTREASPAPDECQTPLERAFEAALAAAESG
jgi:hypothetical protein